MPRTTKLSKPDAMRGAPEPPARLSDAGKALWKHALGMRPAAEWRGADAALLEMHVRAVLDVQRLDEQIAIVGEVYTSPSGGLVVHPLVGVRKARERTAIETAVKLKLTPSSRYTSRRAGELERHATKASRAADLIDSDDLLAGAPRSLQ